MTRGRVSVISIWASAWCCQRCANWAWKVLDLMLISHAHADHAGGARAVAKGLPVKHVLSGEPAGLAGELQAARL